MDIVGGAKWHACSNAWRNAIASCFGQMGVKTLGVAEVFLEKGFEETSTAEVASEPRFPSVSCIPTFETSGTFLARSLRNFKPISRHRQI
jgi:hypothetical protein